MTHHMAWFDERRAPRRLQQVVRPERQPFLISPMRF